MSKRKPYDYVTAVYGAYYQDGPAYSNLKRVLSKLVREAVMQTPDMMKFGLSREEAAKRIAKELIP